LIMTSVRSCLKRLAVAADMPPFETPPPLPSASSARQDGQCAREEKRGTKGLEPQCKGASSEIGRHTEQRGASYGSSTPTSRWDSRWPHTIGRHARHG
jgi:hypothetical protein